MILATSLSKSISEGSSFGCARFWTNDLINLLQQSIELTNHLLESHLDNFVGDGFQEIFGQLEAVLNNAQHCIYEQGNDSTSTLSKRCSSITRSWSNLLGGAWGGVNSTAGCGSRSLADLRQDTDESIRSGISSYSNACSLLWMCLASDCTEQ